MAKYSRLTMAKRGMGPQMELIKKGSMPKTRKRRARRKGI